MEFKNLGFVVVDEQHRFGVHQRLKLSSKGKMVDMLVMSATPIPRTLALTIYGDMDLSILDEKPLGRKDILTCAMNVNKINDVVEGLKRAISDDKQIYWVCPLVEETLKSDLKAVTERFENLKSIFGDKVGMVHGKLKPEEKDKAINDFASGKTKILVATTVIEVGIDVKSATIMIIEHSERFGLSQLHQLRGRVGRNDEDSSCVLLYADNLTDVAKQRINVLRNTNDGFKIAEEDLKIRGMGDVLGTKQSGIPEFKLADLSLDNDLLKIASQDARLIIKNDPELKSIRGQNLRTLLYLFNQDQAISNLRSG
ncbi:MAG: ATP-dependent DNA helicase RecG [Alphaproteobacteria bacterium ADurb.Bin438]|nr:MAG: ATP-dependent DNA helicase RecG [Alphaproteobacteria bacterium ADurb.Bin438]